MPSSDTPVTGLVLAAGGSSRLGRPKQLLPYGPGTLLDHVLGTARACRFAQLLCVLGGAADEVSGQVDFSGVTVVRNRSFGEGCSSSIAVALAAACGYADGRGHPLVFARSMFGELAQLHGDKGVWKLLDRHAADVVDVPVPGPIPPDVDTWQDYEAVLAAR